MEVSIAKLRCSKLTKEERRILKKQIRSQTTLLRHDNIQCSSGPTKHVLVGNGGLGNGVSREQLWSVFESFGGRIVGVLMEERKPYAFVTFESAEHAVATVSRLQGMVLPMQEGVADDVEGVVKEGGEDKGEAGKGEGPPSGGVKLYLSFVEQLPEAPDASELSHQMLLPSGLLVHENALSEKQEQLLLSCIRWDDDNICGRVLKHRQVKHYGYEFRYDINRVDPNHPLSDGIPPECWPVLTELRQRGVIRLDHDQLTVNQYQPGQGIPPHVDTHSCFEDEIVMITLQSQVVMEFRSPDSSIDIPVLLPRRSVAVVTGEARYRWSHGITPRKSDIILVTKGGELERGELARGGGAGMTEGGGVEVDVRGGKEVDVGGEKGVTEGAGAGVGLSLVRRGVRTSFTFRKVRQGPCQCAYLEQCDSQSQLKSPSSSGQLPPSRSAETHQSQMTSGDQDRQAVLRVETGQSDKVLARSGIELSEFCAVELERTHVHKVYEAIGDHFSSTRHKPWPRVTQFLMSLPPASIVADVGCGNGKYLGVNPQLYMLGSDMSEVLCDISRHRSHEMLRADILSLPLRRASCDAVICIAVIHHLATESRRVAALQHLAYFLRPGGQALIYVWALEQQKDCIKSKYLRSACDRLTNQRTALTQPVPITHIHTAPVEILRRNSLKNNGPNDEGLTLYNAEIDNLISCKTGNQALSENGRNISESVSSESRAGLCDMERRAVVYDSRSTDVCAVLPIHINRTEFNSQDIFVPWHKKSQSNKNCGMLRTEQRLKQQHVEQSEQQEEKIPEKQQQQKQEPATDNTHHRYYHVFKSGELERLCNLISPAVKIIENYYDEGNWCILLQAPL